MGYIVGCVYNNDPDNFLEEMYKMIEYEIGINFDSKTFYLMEYKKIDKNNIQFNIDDKFIPLDLLRMIRKLIRHSMMRVNIKNKKYLIHFKDFVNEVHLEDKCNTLRICAFLQMHNYVSTPIQIRIFLINKLVQVRTKLKDTSEDMIRYKIQKYRLEVILKAIENNTIQQY
jgi:hypothetical protein